MLKAWKARLSAYESLITLFTTHKGDDSSLVFNQYENDGAAVREWVRDANAVSQEKGVEALCALVRGAPGKGVAR